MPRCWSTPSAATSRYGTRYTILTSAGGIDGAFGDVVSDLAFLTPTLSYDDTTVYLMLNRNDVSFSSIGATRNQRAVGGAVEAGGPGWKVYDNILVSTTEEAQQAFDLLSGEAHASVGARAVQPEHAGDRHPGQPPAPGPGGHLPARSPRSMPTVRPPPMRPRRRNPLPSRR